MTIIASKVRMIRGIKLLHSHGRIVGIAHNKTFHYPHKASVTTMCPHISMGLYSLACLAVNCPGIDFPEHWRRHAEEHRAWRKQRGLPPPTEHED